MSRHKYTNIPFDNDKSKECFKRNMNVLSPILVQFRKELAETGYTLHIQTDIETGMFDIVGLVPMLPTHTV